MIALICGQSKIYPPKRHQNAIKDQKLTSYFTGFKTEKPHYALEKISFIYHHNIHFPKCFKDGKNYL